MKTIIESFESVSGWTPSASTVQVSQNKFPSAILVGSASMRMKVDDADGQYIHKAFSDLIIVGENDSVRFMVLPRFVFPATAPTLRMTVYRMGITLRTWNIPTSECRKNVVTVAMEGIEAFDAIRFTVVGNGAAAFFFSYMILCKDEAVIDHLLAIQEDLNEKLMFSLGTLAADYAAGSAEVILPDWKNVSKYSVLAFRNPSGVILARHQVDSDISTGIVAFSKEFDGPALLTDIPAGTEVVLIVPAVIESAADLVNVPGICIYGHVPFVRAGHPAQVTKDSFTDTGYRITKQGFDMELNVTIDVRCMQPELMVLINNLIQDLYGDAATIMVNGVLQDIDYYNDPVFEDAAVAGDIPATIHTFTVKLIEQLRPTASRINYVTGTLHVTFRTDS